jgi:hypothetical protein
VLRRPLTIEGSPQQGDGRSWSTVGTTTEIRPFRVEISDAALEDLRRRIAERVELDLLDAYDATYGRGLATATSED